MGVVKAWTKQDTKCLDSGLEDKISWIIEFSGLFIKCGIFFLIICK